MSFGLLRILVAPTLACACAALATLTTVSATEGELEKFYGYWHPETEDWCNIPKDEWETEGAQIIIGPKSIYWGGTCSDVAMWIKEGKMRVSAACNDGIHGHNSINSEFWLSDDGRLHVNRGISAGKDSGGWKKCPNL